MTDISVTAVTTIEGTKPNSDGSYALLKLATIKDELVLAIPEDQLRPLMVSLSDVAGKCRSIRQQNPHEIHVFGCDWWEFGFDQSGQNLVLSFRIPGGMRVSFQIARDQISRMRETLQSMEGDVSTIPPPGTPRQ